MLKYITFGNDLILTDSQNDLVYMWNSSVFVMGPRGKEEFVCMNQVIAHSAVNKNSNLKTKQQKWVVNTLRKGQNPRKK